jgi:ATP-binding cassette subfamily B protein
VPAYRASLTAATRWAVAAVGLAWEAARWQLLSVAVLSVLDGAVPVGAAWALRSLLNDLTRSEVSGWAVSLAVVGIVLCGFIGVAGHAAQSYLQTVMHRLISITVEARLFRAIHSVDGVASFENPAKLDQIRLAEQAGGAAPQGVIESGMSLVQAGVTALGFVLAILVLCPWLVLVVAVAAVPTALLQLRLAGLRAGVQLETSVYQRRLIFYRLLATNVQAAKEVRLFGLANFLIARMLRELGRSNAVEAAADRSAARIGLVIGALSGAVSLVGASAATYLAANHRLGVGDVTVLLAAIVALQATVAQVTECTATGYGSLLLFSQYLAVTEVAVATEPTAPAGVEAPPLTDSIEFDEVWFRYSADQSWVLRGLSCRLPAGQAIGLVGLNGAGKSTMIKLLCRMYEPERGCIRWDGIDIATMDPALLRMRISAVFQDFMAYDFSAADNIAIGSLDAMGDLDRISEAAARAGADQIIRGLPRGYQTMLSRIFPPDEQDGRGAALSGGQWQRLALARAFLRKDADVLILDEPSSGLDAQVEHALHHTLGSMRDGRLSLLISHRLSGLRSADLILVLEDGCITERGTPAELATSGGTFARLFELQAEGYRLPAAKSRTSDAVDSRG